MICRRSFVSGRVQGVFYRATCVRKAQSLGVTGFARNLADGRVEVAGLRRGRRGRGSSSHGCGRARRLRRSPTSPPTKPIRRAVQRTTEFRFGVTFGSRPRSSAPFQRVHWSITLSEYQRLPVLPL